LPWSALFRDENGPAVWMIDPTASTVSLKSVVVDRYLNDVVVVSSGLNPGDTIVATGLQLLRPGEKVTAKPGAAP
jgi:multidrug efflux pump subunit AcrA (membrane-fusion protein)